MAMRAAMVTARPAGLASGRKCNRRDAAAVRATIDASTKSNIAATREALLSEIDIGEIQGKSTTTAESSSTRLSAPKAIMAGLCALIAA
jgi:hypothetical protein